MRKIVVVTTRDGQIIRGKILDLYPSQTQVVDCEGQQKTVTTAATVGIHCGFGDVVFIALKDISDITAVQQEAKEPHWWTPEHRSALERLDTQLEEHIRNCVAKNTL